MRKQRAGYPEQVTSFVCWLLDHPRQCAEVLPIHEFGNAPQAAARCGLAEQLGDGRWAITDKGARVAWRAETEAKLREVLLKCEQCEGRE